MTNKEMLSPFDPKYFDPLSQLKKELFEGQDALGEFFSLNNLQEYWHETCDISEIQTLPLPNLDMDIAVTRDPSTGHLKGYFENFGPEQPSFSPEFDETKRKSLLLSDQILSKLPGTDKEMKMNGTGEATKDLDIENIDARADDLVSETLLALNPKFRSNSHAVNGGRHKYDHDMEDRSAKCLSTSPSVITDEDLIEQAEAELKNEKWYEEVAINKNFDIHEKIPDMAFSWPFELDSFQKAAIYELEKGNSVFVSAHTSAGKTVIAEYAVALSLKHMTRTVYTSPIKALSNQKFRDFKQTFTDVGLITGDVQINPDASCLIMTTEILRSMLYMNNDIIKELEYIIFDEVHYINDADRGVVWEEVLILLPETTKLVLLSATVPNVIEFASWIGKTKQQKIYICKTLNRPIPLEYNLYVQQDASKTHKNQCDDENSGWGPEDDTQIFQPFFDSKKRQFDMKKFKTLQDSFKNQKKTKSFSATNAAEAKKFATQQLKQYYLKLIRDLTTKNFTPTIIFIFSRKKIDMISELIMENVSLNSPSEVSAANTFFRKSITQLKKADQELPQVKRLYEIIKKGYAVHHSGVLPILKEIVEMLFQRGLIKVLLATETFGMGVNMPARTVIFDAMEKFDGTNRRMLLSGEFTQMSGRAGRRGIDDIGRVIISTLNDFPNDQKMQKLITDDPEVLKSKFKLTYRMILNLLRVEILDAEHVIKHSFLEFSSKSSLPGLLKQINDLKIKKSSVNGVVNCTQCSLDNLKVIEEYQAILKEFFTIIAPSRKKTARRTLCPGRLVFADCGRNHIVPVIITDIPVPENNQAPTSLKYYGISFPRLPICVMNFENGQVLYRIDPNINYETDHLNRIGTVSLDYQALASDEHYSKASVAHYSYFFTDKIVSVSHCVVDYDFKTLISNPIYSRSKHAIRGNLLSGDTHKEMKSVIISFFNDHKKKAREFMKMKYKQPNNGDHHRKSVHMFENSGLALDLVDLCDQLKLDKQFKNDLKVMQTKVLKLDIWKCKEPHSHISWLHNKSLLDEKINNFENLLNKREQTQYLPEYTKRLSLLKSMGHVDESNLVTLKGRVACEFCVHELLMADLLMDNVFKDMSIEILAGVLSCLVHEGSSKKPKDRDLSDNTLGGSLSDRADPQLVSSLHMVIGKAKYISQIQHQFLISSDNSIIIGNDVADGKDNGEELADYMSQMNFDLCETVYHWTKGESFSTIISGTDIQEGIVVRCIQRLEELIRNLRESAKLIGELTLQQKTEETLNAIKRDIVFTASLYTD